MNRILPIAVPFALSLRYANKILRLSNILFFKSFLGKIDAVATRNTAQRVSEIRIGMFHIEYVPKTSWHRSIARLAQGRIWFGNKEIILPDDLRLAFNRIWQRIRRRELMRAGYKCEICGEEKNLQVHEIWEYDFRNRVQRLVGYKVLCSKCHRVHHSSYLVRRDDIDDLVYYVWKVNTTRGEFISRVVISSRLYKAYEIWLDRSNICWKIDISREPYLEPLHDVADVLLNFWIYLRERKTLIDFLEANMKYRNGKKKPINNATPSLLLEKLFEYVRSRYRLSSL